MTNSTGDKPQSLWSRRNPFKKPDPVKEKEVAVEEEAVEEVDGEVIPKGIPNLFIQSASITVSDPTIRVDISIRNRGTGLAEDTKVKVLAGPMMRPLTSPMVNVGDMPPRDKKNLMISFEMSKNFVDEYANFSIIVDSPTAKSTQMVATTMTGRRPLSGTELLEQKEAELRKRLSGGKDPKEKKGKGKNKDKH